MTVVERAPTIEVDLLITGGLVVTMAPGRPIFEGGAVAISRGRIAMVGPAVDVGGSVRPRRIVEARRKIVLPGLIDAHAHAGHSLTKAIGAHLPTAEWARLLDHVYFHATTPEYWYADGLLSGLERLRFGTTTAVMMLGSQPRTDVVDYGEAFSRGTSRSGARTVISVGPAAPPWPKVFTHWRDGRPQDAHVTYEQCLAVTEELIERWKAEAQRRIGVMVGPPRFSIPSRHNLFFEPEHLQYAKREAEDIRHLADKHKIWIHTHAYGETVEYLHGHLPDVLGPDVLLVHCTGISKLEQEILARLDVKVAHCPTARRPYLGPRCPVPELMDAGVTVAVATDASAPDRSFDLFETMRAAQRLQRVHFSDPNYLPAEKMLETVTVDAARAIGMETELGTLEVGKRADVILVDRFRPHTTPSLVPLWQLVHWSSGGDVTDVFVDGEQVVANGRSTSVDEDEVLRTAEEEARKMISRAGIASIIEGQEGFWGRSRI